MIPMQYWFSVEGIREGSRFYLPKKYNDPYFVVDREHNKAKKTVGIEVDGAKLRPNYDYNVVFGDDNTIVTFNINRLVTPGQKLDVCVTSPVYVHDMGEMKLESCDYEQCGERSSR